MQRNHPPPVVRRTEQQTDANPVWLWRKSDECPLPFQERAGITADLSQRPIHSHLDAAKESETAYVRA